MTQPFRGIHVIAQTPFSVDSATILWDEFQREVDWIVRAGAHGFVWPVMASEYTVLSTLDDVGRAEPDYALSQVEPFFAL